MKKPSVEPVEIELIVWHDAVADSGWLERGNECSTDVITSVGRVLKETPEYVTLGGSWDKEATQSNNRMTVPKGMLIRRQTYILD